MRLVSLEVVLAVCAKLDVVVVIQVHNVTIASKAIIYPPKIVFCARIIV